PFLPEVTVRLPTTLSPNFTPEVAKGGRESNSASFKGDDKARSCCHVAFLSITAAMQLYIVMDSNQKGTYHRFISQSTKFMSLIRYSINQTMKINPAIDTVTHSAS